MKITKWLEDVDFFDGKIQIESIHETDTTQEVRIILPEGKAMKEHKAPSSITIQVLKGKVWLDTDGIRHELYYGDMVSLDENIPHFLGAFKNSVIRITLSKIDTVQRMQKAI